MKRGILALAGVGAALVLPVVGSTGANAAQKRDDFQISFTLKSLDGEAKALKDFRFSKLNGSCAGGVTVEVRGKFRFIRINDRNRFSDTLRREDRKVSVKGRVSSDLDKVVGRIRAIGDFPPDAEDCDTDWVRWKAE